MSRYPYLLNRNGYYYFRIAIPLPLVPAIGRRELVHSLKTKIYAEAVTRSWPILAAAQSLFRDAYDGIPIPENRIKECFESLALSLGRPHPILSKEPKISEIDNGEETLVSKLFEEYLKECQGDREKTIAKKRGVKDLWIEINGNKPVKEINQEQARLFKQTLIKLPANLKQRHRGISIIDINLE